MSCGTDPLALSHTNIVCVFQEQASGPLGFSSVQLLALPQPRYSIDLSTSTFVKMKSTILSVFGLAATVVAQSAGDLPQCGQTCAGNMIGAEKSKELGCDTGDLQCLCTNQNFIYGLRDCSRAICSEEQAAQVLEYGLSVCRQAGVKITTGASGSVSATPTVTGIVRTVLSTIVSGDSTIVSAVSTISAAASETEDEETVSTYTSVFTNSDGDVVTTTGETTIGAAAAKVTTFTSDGTEIVRTLETETATDDEDENLTTFTSGGTKIVSTLVTKTATDDEEADVTTFTSDGTEIVRTLTTKTVKTGSATETVTDASTATETEDSTETGETDESSETGTATGTGEASETTSTGNAAVPQMTAAPAGMLAAAGLAMLLL
ncbi:hypothetical protein BHE90_014730 [Fusarium euwallaceae]|uniref:CFEM domain-containing protein n=3 Tax=Fusarium solani species complex TaxID=232080 RepID=A0A3M2S3G3_9HYPO|nr:hypothetical protein CDV36_008285 [Fusarium kuroshium]RTE70875.1 hypothetical protein BHE90_014730 [Fusarium euwallaceae]